MSHNAVAQREERGGTQRLRKEVGQVIYCPHEGNDQRVILHFLSDVEMSARNVLGPRVMLRIIGQIAPGLVVHAEGSGLLRGNSVELSLEMSKVLVCV